MGQAVSSPWHTVDTHYVKADRSQELFIEELQSHIPMHTHEHTFTLSPDLIA